MIILKLKEEVINSNSSIQTITNSHNSYQFFLLKVNQNQQVIANSNNDNNRELIQANNNKFNIERAQERLSLRRNMKEHNVNKIVNPVEKVNLDVNYSKNNN